MKNKLICSLVAILLLTQCSYYGERNDHTKLTSVTIIDNNGFTETITAQDRLSQYKGVDFSKAQAYQRVLRVFGRDETGNVKALLTSYHPNGELKQYLEAKNNTAFGTYREWYENGQLKLEAHILNGTADLTPIAEKTWIFEGKSTVWDSKGNINAIISYNKGVLDGDSLYFHSNNNLWKRVPFSRGLVCGIHETFLEDGSILQTTPYVNGKRHGVSKRYWPCGTLAFEECYDDHLLVSGNYWSADGKPVQTIAEGSGKRVLFSASGIAELQEYRHGRPEGEVNVFDASGVLVQLYHVKNDLRHGEEVEFYEKKLGAHTVKPKLSLMWHEGKIQGVVKTWYETGTLESQREMSHNKKNGLSTAWYRDGSVMMIEDYEQDHLVRGEYFKRGEKMPSTQVWEGNGLATLFDSEGNFLRKITYLNGKPQE